MEASSLRGRRFSRTSLHQPGSRLFSLRRRHAWPAPNSPAAWAFAFTLILAAGIAKPGLEALTNGSLPPYIAFYPVVVIAALGGGPRVGLAAAVLTLLLSWFFYLRVEGSFAFADDQSLLTIAVYSFTSTFLGWVVGEARLVSEEAIASELRRDHAARESVHRIKNLLSVVQALVLKISSEAESVPEYRDILLARLAALDAAQGVLLRRDWGDAELTELIRSALTPFLPNPGLTIETGPEALVPARHVSGLCMALFELCTNSMKYGALAKGRGPVVLGWRADDETIVLEWYEESSAPKTKEESFGTLLIRTALANEAGTDVEYNLDETMVRARFRWPRR